MEENSRVIMDMIRPDIQRVLRDPVTLCRVLQEVKVVDKSLFDTVLQMAAHFNTDSIWDLIFKELPRRCTVYKLEQALDWAGYKRIAAKLNRLAFTFFRKHGINSGVPCLVENREGLQLFFKKLKREIYNGIDYSFLNHMSAHMERILFSNTPQRGNITPDKYVITLAVMLDSPIEENELFIHGLTEVELCKRQEIISKLQKIISKTPNQYISSMFLFPRMAIENALTGDFKKGEENVDLALQHAFLVCNCVEKADMYYRIVHFYHRLFEFTQSEDALKSLLKYGDCGIRCLDREQDKVGHQWKRLFLLRMALCSLGMSTECREINDRACFRENVADASKYLAEVDEVWEGIEKKAKLLYFIARTRLCDVQNEIELALHFAKDLKKIAEENKSKHLVFVVKYIHDLQHMRSSGFQILKSSRKCRIREPLVREDTKTGSNKVMRRGMGNLSSEENNPGVNELIVNVSDFSQFSSLSGPEGLTLAERTGNTSINEETARISLEQEDEPVVQQLHELKIATQYEAACTANSENIPSQKDLIDWQNSESSLFDLNFVMSNGIGTSTILHSPLHVELTDSVTEQRFTETREEPEGASFS